MGEAVLSIIQASFSLENPKRSATERYTGPTISGEPESVKKIPIPLTQAANCPLNRVVRWRVIETANAAAPPDFSINATKPPMKVIRIRIAEFPLSRSWGNRYPSIRSLIACGKSKPLCRSTPNKTPPNKPITTLRVQTANISVINMGVTERKPNSATTQDPSRLCSKAIASAASRASLKAGPVREIPTGRLCNFPIGSVICG